MYAKVALAIVSSSSGSQPVLSIVTNNDQLARGTPTTRDHLEACNGWKLRTRSVCVPLRLFRPTSIRPGDALPFSAVVLVVGEG